MLTRRRIVLGLLAIVVVGVAFTAWQVYRVQRDLTQANEAAQQLRASISSEDETARRAALSDLRLSAAAAHDHSDGAWWGALTHLPVVGDDVTGIRALSSSLDTLAAGGIQPLADAVDDLTGISSGGGVDLTAVAALQQPMNQAAGAFAAARDDVAGLDSSGYAGALETRFGQYVRDVESYDASIRSAAKATDVLPDMLGADGPHDYLLVFQNNAEIRATGGLPGSWALVHAEGGALSITRQGTAGDFPRLEKPVLPLTQEEEAVYSDLLGVFYQDANFTPDFPRTAELWRARWEDTFAPTTLSGVVSFDPVALSYLLNGTGPVQVGDVTLTADNAVQQLLNQPYLTLDTGAQDAFFASAATAIFTAVTGDLASPIELVKGVARAADEGRFLIASYDDQTAAKLRGSDVLGPFSSDADDGPSVQIGLNDATGSKMSYYLRYRARVTSQSCAASTQSLQGAMTLNQTITSAQAKSLPDSITGAGYYGTTPGSQTVAVRIYGPAGGTIGPIRIDGAMVDFEPQPLNGRPVATILVQLNGPDDVVVNWEMQAGPGQVGDGTVGVTPGVTGGSKDSIFVSSC